MTASVILADLGQSTAIDAATLTLGTRLVVTSRSGRLQLASHAHSIWFQLRGAAVVEAREGRFHLSAGDWIALDQESLPVIHAARKGLTLGVISSPQAMSVPRRAVEYPIFPGRGHCRMQDRLITSRMWHEAARLLQSTTPGGAPPCTTLDPLLSHVATLQRDVRGDFDRCPGKSRNQKAKIFERLQRARLFLEGNGDRIVSLDELALLTSFSRWYLSKTFLATYGEHLHKASRRIRIERSRKLLTETSLSICEVAASCGFENPSSFTRAFRSETGTTPTIHRDSHRRGSECRSLRQTPTPARISRFTALTLSPR